MLRKVTLRQMEFAVGAAFLAVAVLAAVEGARLGPGWGDTGPQPGFFPFALAVLMGAGALGAIIHAARHGSADRFFEVRQEIVDLVKVGAPMAVAIALVPTIGLYLMAALYVAFFSWWYGRFAWWSALVAGAAVLLALYLVLDVGFRLPMPRSVWYGSYLPL